MKRRDFLLCLYLSAVSLITFPSGLFAESAFSKSLKPIVKEISAMTPDNKPVVVFPFQDVQGNITLLGTYLSEQIQIAIANKSVMVVERRALEAALNEEKLRQAGFLNEKTVVQIGRFVGAKIAVYGTVLESKKLIAINLKVVDIEKAVTLGGAVWDIQRNRKINQIINTFPDRYAEPNNSTTSYEYRERTKFSIGLSYLGMIAVDKKQFGHGSGGLVTLLYDMGDYFDAEVCVGHYGQQIKQDRLPLGSVSVTSIQGGLRFNFLGKGQVAPYVSAGLGLYSISNQKHDSVDTEQINLCPDEKYPCPANLNSGSGAYGGVGVNIHLNATRTMTLTLDGRYAPFSSNTGADIQPPPPSARGFRLGGFMASGGFLYRY